MKVLGIDPGTAACGYGIVHESDGRLKELCHGWWRTKARERVELRLLEHELRVRDEREELGEALLEVEVVGQLSLGERGRLDELDEEIGLLAEARDVR